jgi:hypothetical protein
MTISRRTCVHCAFDYNVVLSLQTCSWLIALITELADMLSRIPTIVFRSKKALAPWSSRNVAARPWQKFGPHNTYRDCSNAVYRTAGLSLSTGICHRRKISWLYPEVGAILNLHSGSFHRFQSVSSIKVCQYSSHCVWKVVMVTTAAWSRVSDQAWMITSDATQQWLLNSESISRSSLEFGYGVFISVVIM